MIEKSKEYLEIAKALLIAQPKIDTALKATEGHYGKFADFCEVLNVIKKPLNDVGVLIIQSPDIGTNADGVQSPILITTLIHAETGQYFCSNTPILCAKQNDPPAFGSGLSYAKRYGLQAMGVIPSEDDDGKLAARKAANAPKPTELEWQCIDAIIAKMPPVPAIDRDKLAKWFLADKGKYPSTKARVNVAAEHVMQKNPQNIYETTPTG